MAGRQQPRVRPGVPQGGQYSATQRPEADSTDALEYDTAASQVAPQPLTRQVLAERHERLTAGGYVPAMMASSPRDIRETVDVDGWWHSHMVTAEHGGQVTQMPADYTPTGRRLPRMLYEGGEVAVRMPSVTACRRFDQEHRDTFDIPVEADIPGSGKPVSGWVRVTRDGDRWATTALNFDEPADLYVGEAVAAVLESRRPRSVLTRIGDVADRHRQRVETSGEPILPVSSSWIAGVGYDDTVGALITETQDGRSYGHQVSRDVFDRVRGGASPGRAFTKLVRGNPRVDIERCNSCRRYSPAGRTHRCPPPQHKTGTGDPGDTNRQHRSIAEKLTGRFGHRSQ